MIEIVL